MNPELLARTHELFLEQGRDRFPQNILFPLLPSDITIPQGHLNVSVVVESRDQSLYLLRQQNEEVIRSQVFGHLEWELGQVGFLTNPKNRFWVKSVEDQQAFAHKLRDSGINTPTVFYAANRLQVIEYIPGTNRLSDLWLEGDQRAVSATRDVIFTVTRMHKRGIVAGERWGPNELIAPDGKVYLVDFDIGIEGPEARECDLTNLIYYTAYFAQEGDQQNLAKLKDVYITTLNDPEIYKIYDKEILLRYIASYAEFFASDKKRGTKFYFRWKDPQDSVRFFTSLLNEIAK